MKSESRARLNGLRRSGEILSICIVTRSVVYFYFDGFLAFSSLETLSFCNYQLVCLQRKLVASSSEQKTIGWSLMIRFLLYGIQRRSSQSSDFSISKRLSILRLNQFNQRSIKDSMSDAEQEIQTREITQSARKRFVRSWWRWRRQFTAALEASCEWTNKQRWR